MAWSIPINHVYGQPNLIAQQLGSTGSLIAPNVAIPRPGQRVSWTSHLRIDIPLYVFEQFREAAHRKRCTQVSLLLWLMAEHRDPEGHPLFFVRPEDLVADRRKSTR
jgi:hypothetical protein